MKIGPIVPGIYVLKARQPHPFWEKISNIERDVSPTPLVEVMCNVEHVPYHFALYAIWYQLGHTPSRRRIT